VADLRWHGYGPEFTIEVAGRRWLLKLDKDHPGLSWSDGCSRARLLGLDHVAAMGRRDETAFDGSSLVSVERYRGRVQATYIPPGWHGLNVRAAWGPTPDLDGIDLEVQVWATSTGVFRRVEVAIASAWSELARQPPPAGHYQVEPRDVHAAALSYDGREPAAVLRYLMTMGVPVTSPHDLDPVCYPIPGPHTHFEQCYMEMVQPNDCARRIIGESAPEGIPQHPALAIRYGLFGHDLEKGVVLRGRIRGIWIRRITTDEDRRRCYEAFLREPPALGP
jgi:hypothetical protein